MPDREQELRERVLTSIAQEKITPKPRWHFLLHEGVVWLVVVLAFVLGTVASTLSIYILSASRFMVHTARLSDIDVLFEAVPLLWLVLLSVGMFYTVHAFKETRNGYRVRTAWLVLGALVASVGAGYGLHAAGVGEALDRYLLTEAPLYRPMSGFHPRHWMHAPAGVLVGEVTHVESDAFTLRTLEGEEWRIVEGTTTDPIPPCGARTGTVREGLRVRVFGTTTSEGTYVRFALCDFQGRGMSRERERPPMEWQVKEN